MLGKRQGTTVTKHVTNERNLDSLFWRSMLADLARHCLVPFTQFAEPKIGAGATNIGSVWSMRRLQRSRDRVPDVRAKPVRRAAAAQAMPILLDPTDYDR